LGFYATGLSLEKLLHWTTRNNKISDEARQDFPKIPISARLRLRSTGKVELRLQSQKLRKPGALQGVRLWG